MSNKSYADLVWEKNTTDMAEAGHSDVMERYRAYYPIDDDGPKDETNEQFIRRCAALDDEDGLIGEATYQDLWKQAHYAPPTPTLRLVLEVSYDANGVPVDVLTDMLEQMVARSIGEGGLTGSLDAEVEEWKVTATAVSPEALTLDEEQVADWISSQVESGNMSPEDIPQLMARYALEDSAQMREELAERMGLFEPVTE